MKHAYILTVLLLATSLNARAEGECTFMMEDIWGQISDGTKDFVEVLDAFGDKKYLKKNEIFVNNETGQPDLINLAQEVVLVRMKNNGLRAIQCGITQSECGEGAC